MRKEKMWLKEKSTLKITGLIVIGFIFVFFLLKQGFSTYMQFKPFELLAYSLEVCVDAKIDYSDNLAFEISHSADENYCQLNIISANENAGIKAKCQLNKRQIDAIRQFSSQKLKGSHSVRMLIKDIPFKFKFESNFNAVSSPFDEILPQCEYQKSMVGKSSVDTVSATT